MITPERMLAYAKSVDALRAAQVEYARTHCPDLLAKLNRLEWLVDKETPYIGGQLQLDVAESERRSLDAVKGGAA